MNKTKDKLLIVDDDRLALQIYSDALINSGYIVDSVSEGSEAIAKIDNTEYDLIICDIVLSDMSGIDILKHSKKTSTAVDVILITAHYNIDNVLGAFQFGASDYLKKPITPPELIFIVERLLDRKKVLNSYAPYKRYNELLQLSQQISMSIDLNSLVHSSMQGISHYLKAKKAIFVKYKPDAKKKFKILGKQNITDNDTNTVIENFVEKNTIDSSLKPSIEDKLICIPLLDVGINYFLFFLEPAEQDNNNISFKKEHGVTEINFLQKHIALSLKNILQLSDARKLAITDGLTGLRNHRYLEVSLELELQKAKKNKIPLSVLFIDIDRFKEVNDTYGHLIGSKILCELADVMKRSVRDPDRDKIIRYGGDEYVIILSNLDTDGAYMVAERLRKKVEDYIFLKSDKKIKVTISIGVSSYPETSFTKEEILTLADKALYEAKKKSRNIVYKAKDMDL